MEEVKISEQRIKVKYYADSLGIQILELDGYTVNYEHYIDKWLKMWLDYRGVTK